MICTVHVYSRGHYAHLSTFVKNNTKLLCFVWDRYLEPATQIAVSQILSLHRTMFLFISDSLCGSDCYLEYISCRAVVYFFPAILSFLFPSLRAKQTFFSAEHMNILFKGPKIYSCK